MAQAETKVRGEEARLSCLGAGGEIDRGWREKGRGKERGVGTKGERWGRVEAEGGGSLMKG